MVPTEGLSGSKVDYLNRLVRKKGSTFSLSSEAPVFAPLLQWENKGGNFPDCAKGGPFLCRQGIVFGQSAG